MANIKHFLLSRRKQILDFLAAQGVIPKKDLPELEDLLNNKEAELEDLLLKYITRERLLTLKGLYYQNKYRAVNLFEVKGGIEDRAIEKLTREQILEYRLLVIFENNGDLTVAMDDPADDEAVEFVENQTGGRVTNRYVALYSDICNIISQGRLIIHLLLKQGILNNNQIKEIGKYVNRKDTELEDILLRFVNREVILQAKSLINNRQYKHVDLFEIRDGLEDDITGLLTKNQMLEYRMMIVYAKDGNIALAMADPSDGKAVRFVESMTGEKVTTRYATLFNDIVHTVSFLEERRQLRAKEDRKATTRLSMGGVASPQAIPTSVELIDVSEFSLGGAEIGGVRPLIESIIKRALVRGASDVHIEPIQGNSVKVRYRIDGILCNDETIDYAVVRSMEPNLSDKLVSIVKILSGESGKNMRIDISDKPQDGRIFVPNVNLDLRIAVLPTVLGESIVIRVLRRDWAELTLEQLGFEPDTLENFAKIIDMPYGMVLVSGPTGSGKSTTQYAIMRKLNTPGKKILTIEDPVEYSIPGAVQTQINEIAGFTFKEALRSFVRNDPDVIMVGEIRDVITAAMAMEAALTGHLVLSSIHANDAVSTIFRLKDMGVDTRLITATCLGTLGQRLVRRICPYCKRPFTFSTRLYQAMEQMGIKFKPGDLMKGFGCSRCYTTGYQGRIGVYELLAMTYEIKELFLSDAPAEKIMEAASRKQGMRTLFEDVLTKVSRGITTEEEVWRVTLLESASWKINQ
ncbi:MAG: type II/IV secretion system protein [Firmicutes bacterium]|nr:type II/IV secretion system protein [Bacillota bacterium]